MTVTVAFVTLSGGHRETGACGTEKERRRAEETRAPEARGPGETDPAESESPEISSRRRSLHRITV